MPGTAMAGGSSARSCSTTSRAASRGCVAATRARALADGDAELDRRLGIDTWREESAALMHGDGANLMRGNRYQPVG